MDKFHSLLLTFFLLKTLENSYSTYHGNIYGIKRLVSNKTTHPVHQHFWFKRHHVHLRQRYPKTLVFAKASVHACSQKQNFKTIRVKRIGGNYPYGPKLSSISENKICHLLNTNSHSHPSSISFSTSRLNIPKRPVAYSQPLKKVQITKRNLWRQNKAWCAHCESYWKMKITSKELKSRHGCC
ncbi:hypothetical protein CRE_17066 [Caenorhabditis remanei]|uniref:Uncharacterized protein n=1 Tax=Caenorhabditis remanei TaxID=31234 RepID=E3M9Z0_CAERE|nr:hypothetical protein CRE_17066 [Caenorhabditis remanei]